MTDFSHWDFAEHFRGIEAAHLIMGFLPERKNSIEGLIQGGDYAEKLTPILRRMDHAFRGARSTLNSAATWGKDPKEALEKFPMIETQLHSLSMIQARDSDTEYGLSQFKNLSRNFDEVYFGRSEIHRWLKAIGFDSVYQFIKENAKYQFIKENSKKIEIVTSNLNELTAYEKAFLEPFDDALEEFKQWLIMDTWPDEGAMWLMAGVIPREIYEGMGFFTTDLCLLHNDEGEKDEKLHVIGNLIRLWRSNPDNPQRAKPSVFLNWAAQKKIPISWLDRARGAGYLLDPESKVTYDEKPLATTERSTLLSIIAVLCKEAKLDYKTHAKTAGLIQSTAATMGISIGETTIENHLKKIPNALASRMK